MVFMAWLWRARLAFWRSGVAACVGFLLLFAALFFVLGTAILGIAGCSSALDGAVIATNAARDVGVVLEHELVERCQPLYERAETEGAVAAADVRCLAALEADAALASAHWSAVLLLQQAQDGHVDAARLVEVAQHMTAAATRAKAAYAALRGTP